MIVHKITTWIVYGCTLAFILSRMFVSYELYLFHLKDLKDDHHFNSFCQSHEMPKKYDKHCLKAADGVHTPILMRVVQDIITHTLDEATEIGKATYSKIGVLLFGVILIIWIISAIIGRLQSRNPSFIIPLSNMQIPQHQNIPVYDHSYHSSLRRRSYADQRSIEVD